MSNQDLLNRIKERGYEKPQVVVLTPEIRTIDERVRFNSSFDNMDNVTVIEN